MISNLFKKNAINFLMFLAIALITACNSESADTISEKVDTVTSTSTELKNTDGFYDIPSPIVQVQLLQKAGAKYDENILNPLDNIPKYVLDYSKALNLGVYGADMSYAAVFNHPQEAILYLTTSNRLAEELHINGDFYLNVVTRLESNKGNKDSLLKIVSDICYRSNNSLKENDQSHLSVLVVVGSFVEAMYIGTQSAKKLKDKAAIYERIEKFGSTLSNLISLVATAHDDGFSEILSDLKSIKSIYDENPDAKLTEEQMIKITKQVNAVRIRITNT